MKSPLDWPAISSLRAQEKDNSTPFLVLAAVFGVTSTGTYPEFVPVECLVDELNSGAIWWNYFFPAPLIDSHISPTLESVLPAQPAHCHPIRCLEAGHPTSDAQSYRYFLVKVFDHLTDIVNWVTFHTD
jgi:hypothetical protein